MLDRKLVPVALSTLLALSACGGGSSDGDAGNDCIGGPDFDISGTYTERYNCSEGDTCVDQDASFTVQITAINADNGQYSISSAGGWSGTGLICGNLFIWNASTDMYTESGLWTFRDARNFTKTSDYEYTDIAGGGTCTGAATQDGTPPPPAAIGACPMPGV